MPILDNRTIQWLQSIVKDGVVVSKDSNPYSGVETLVFTSHNKRIVIEPGIGKGQDTPEFVISREVSG